MAGLTFPASISLPEQKLLALSYAEAASKPFQQWVGDLPMANIGETARRLYHAIMELNQLVLPATSRLALLELMRPPIRYVVGELSRHFLGQPVVLPEKQRKIANLAQALNLHMATGYKLVVRDLCPGTRQDKVRRSLAQPLYRAISELSLCVLRSAQLYCPPPARCWLEIHSLYGLAEEAGIAHLPLPNVASTSHGEKSIVDAYKRILLLGASKPNQLRQGDISLLYGLFQDWSSHCGLRTEQPARCLFLVAQGRDMPPVYRNFLKTEPDRNLVGFSAEPLVQQLRGWLEHSGKEGKKDPGLQIDRVESLPDDIILALIRTLGEQTERSFKRLSSEGHALITVGLSATHYFCAGQTDFQLLLAGVEHNEPLDSRTFMLGAHRDAWQQSFDASPTSMEGSEMESIKYTGFHQNESRAQHQEHRVPLVNTSPGGYCLEWQGKVSAAVQAGELIGIRESTDLRPSIAVIRWVRQVEQEGTQFGVELLAPHAHPCGLKVLHKAGEHSDYLRGLLLPEIPATGQPMSLITPRLPCHTGQSVQLNDGQYESRARLTHRMTGTSSFSRFELQGENLPKPQVEETAAEGKNNKRRGLEDEFDSLWPTL